MKEIPWAIVVVAVILFALTRNYDGNEQSNSTKIYSESGNDEALTLSKAGPKAKEAVITETDVLYASVEDDGTRRNGYASCLCEISVIREHDPTSICS